MTAAPKVYEAISKVMAALSKEGIAKEGRNTQGAGYNFRGIDQVLNALSGHLVEAGLIIIPRVVAHNQVERVSKNGGALFYTTVEVEFDLISSADGSKHTARTAGEAMDSSDKSTNKSMSAAYKYMAIQTFCIPTEGDNDADGQTHYVEPKQQTPDPAIESLWQELNAIKSLPGLSSFWQDNVKAIKQMDDFNFNRFTAKKDEKKLAFEGQDDGFPGSTDIRDQGGRRLNNIEGG